MLSIALTITHLLMLTASPAALRPDTDAARPAAASADTRTIAGDAAEREGILVPAAVQPPPPPAQPPAPEPPPTAPKPSRSGRGAPEAGAAGRETVAPPAAEPAKGPAANATAESFPPVLFHPKHASCYDLAKVVDRLYPSIRCHADERTNALILAGPAESVAGLLKLFGDFDRPAEPGASSDLAIVPMRYRAADDLADQIRNVVVSRQLRVAADRGRSTVLLNGPAAELSAARQLLAQMDTPAASVTLEFAFFQAGLAEREGAAPRLPIPADLAGVAKELERFGRPDLLGRLSTVALEHEQFRVQGRVSGNITVDVKGRVESAPTDGSVKLEIVSDMGFERAGAASIEDGKPPTSGPSPSFALGTIVLTKRGDYVVLGSAPAGWAAGESAILVLYVKP